MFMKCFPISVHLFYEVSLISQAEPMDDIDRRRLQMKEKNEAILRRHQEIEQDKKMYG